MLVKALEVRDRATFIPVVAVQMTPSNMEQKYLLRRAGYSGDITCVLLTRLDGGEAHYDPYNWADGSRTMRAAHLYVTQNFNKLEDGDVIDVEYILGETTITKTSERYGA
jgi:hypothetical protein